MPTRTIVNPRRPWTADLLRRAEDTDEPLERIVDDVFVAGGPMEQAGFAPRPGQAVLAAMVARSIDRGGWRMGEAPTGCHAAGQLVLRANGRPARVEDVVVGDRLLGPSGIRTVLRLCRGRQEMVDIVPVKGERWRVNLDHVLTLSPTGTDSSDHSMYVDITVAEWSKKSATWRHTHKLVRASAVDFYDGVIGDHPIPPWVLGVILGDGSLSHNHASVSVTTPDHEIVGELTAYCQSVGIELHAGSARGTATNYTFAGPMYNKSNPVTNALRGLGLKPIASEDRFVPNAYLFGSRGVRSEILAGLIDTDGYLTAGCYEYVSKSRRLASNVAFLARSLGLAAYVRSVMKMCPGMSGPREYFRVILSGDIDALPVRVARRKAAPRGQKKDVLRTGFAIESAGVEDYYGFTLDGDGRYLLGDFTITHNSGKSFAYLIPGFLAVRRARSRWDKNDKRPWRLAISTANLALQAQIVGKDAALAASILGLDTTVATMIGRSNYVCPLRLNEARLTFNGFTSADVRAEVDRIADWFDGLDDVGNATKDGLPFAAQPASWARCSTDTDGCAARGCPHHEPKDGFAPCPAERAKASAAAAEVVVLNHAFLTRGYPALGPTAILVVDEGHAFEDAARGAGERRIGRGVAARATKLASEAMPKADASRLVGEPFRALVKAARVYLERSGATRIGDKRPLRPGWAATVHGAPSADDFDAVGKAANAVEALMIGQSDEVERERMKHAIQQLRSMKERAVALLDGRPPAADAAALPGEWAVWGEIDGSQDDGAAIAAAPADAGSVVQAIQKAIPRAAITSATLAPGGDPASTEAGLGAAFAEPTLLLPSPWPLASMGVLVVPVGPGTKDPLWSGWADRQIVSAVRGARGRTLVLCTSWARAKAAAEAIRADRLPYPLLVQGDAGRDVLSARFRTEIDSVLVATRSFFEGLDVQGESLSCVVIEKLPFDPPGDPLEEAAGNVAAKRLGGSPFLARSLPKMLASLVQGAGRALRSPTDRAAIVCLDGRVTERTSIGNAARKALPPFPISTVIDDVGNFLDRRPLLLADPTAPPVTQGPTDDGTVARKRRSS